MLLFRMAILEPVVDYFVVVESMWTHQGQPRERTLGDGAWFPQVRSFYINARSEPAQREAIAYCAGEFNDDDLVILSDVDEIPSREAVSAMEYVDMPKTCNLDLHLYRLNWKRPENCSLIMSTIKQLRELGGEKLRGMRGVPPSIGVQPSGWHLSYFGGTEAIQKKLKSFCHPEFNKPEFLDEEWLDKCQNEGIALLKCGTPLEKSTATDFPQYFLDAAPKGWWL